MFLFSKNLKFKKVMRATVLIAFFFLAAGPVITTQPKQADAFFGCIPVPCWRCIIVDTFVTTEIALELPQEFIWDPLVENDIENHINAEENFLAGDFFSDFTFDGLAELTEYLTINAMFQMQMVGSLFDARNQLETQRLFFQLQAEAHKDYHPSAGMCEFGTGIRSLASTESQAKHNLAALSARSIARQLGTKGTSSATSAMGDKRARWNQFVNSYCDPRDNAWSSAGTGLVRACDRDGPGGSVAAGAQDENRYNRDIDYTRLIDIPKTLNVNFTDDQLTNPAPLPTPTYPPNDPRQETLHDEEDVLALAANLYGHDNLTRRMSFNQLSSSTPREQYNDLRTIIAKRAVAENSFNSIVSMKSAGTGGMLGSAGAETGAFLGAIIRELMPAGTPDEEIIALIGERPSQYAQLELLGKLIYQNPRFFANLYDKPANVERKAVAMKAINLMLDRALLESELRQEMIMSVMLSSKLTERFRSANSALTNQKEQ